MSKEVASVKADGGLATACLKPLENLRSRADTENSLAHITQIEVESLKEFDTAVKRIEEFAKKAAETATEKGKEVILKKHRVVEPAKMVKSPYLETKNDVNEFVDTLRDELEKAIANNERIQIR